MWLCASWTAGHITQNSVIDRQGLITHHTHSDTPSHTHAQHSTAAADVQQLESTTYFFVIRLACWQHILAVVVSGSPAAVIRLSVIKFILLIGPWPWRAQSTGLRLLNTALDLHIPLERLKKGKTERRIRQRRSKHDVGHLHANILQAFITPSVKKQKICDLYFNNIFMLTRMQIHGWKNPGKKDWSGSGLSFVFAFTQQYISSFMLFNFHDFSQVHLKSDPSMTYKCFRKFKKKDS